MNNKITAPAGTEATITSNTQTNIITPVETKISRVLRELLKGRRFNRFEAETRLHDHCLHTTVASIQRDYGIDVSRQFETVPGYMGYPARVCRYWITYEERVKFLARCPQWGEQ